MKKITNPSLARCFFIFRRSKGQGVGVACGWLEARRGLHPEASGSVRRPVSCPADAANGRIDSVVSRLPTARLPTASGRPTARRTIAAVAPWHMTSACRVARGRLQGTGSTRDHGVAASDHGADRRGPGSGRSIGLRPRSAGGVRHFDSIARALRFTRPPAARHADRMVAGSMPGGSRSARNGSPRHHLTGPSDTPRNAEHGDG